MSTQPEQLKSWLRVPGVAWPTLLLAVSSLAMWGLSVWGVATERLGLGWGVLWSTVAFYGLFTPMHEASHQSASRHRWVNEVLGRICGYAMLGVFVGFRHIHLEHHRHTNEPDRDPDMWSATGPAWALPLRWMTQDLYYHVYFTRELRHRPVAERWEVLVTGVALTTALVGLLCSEWVWLTLLLWVLPLKIAFTLLSYSFDYLPHTPHQITSAEDRYGATLARPHPLLRWLLLQQDLHVVHHLYPAVPFYRYAGIWRLQGDDLIAHGVQVRSLTGQILGAPSAL